MQNLDEIVGALYNGSAPYALLTVDGAWHMASPIQGAILSGSFNPLHAGHIAFAQAGSAAVGLPSLFELAIVNADKGRLGLEEVARRVVPFVGNYPLLLTCEPLFTRKALLFPGSVFLLGYDTAIRLVDTRYYGGEDGLLHALDTFRAQGCRLLVAGRQWQGVYQTLADIAVPSAYRDLFIALPEESFRMDISSSELRSNANE